MNKKIFIYALFLLITGCAVAFAAVGDMTTGANITTAGTIGGNAGVFLTAVNSPLYCDGAGLNCMIPGRTVPTGAYVAFPSGTNCAGLAGGWGPSGWNNSTIAGNAVTYCRKN